MASASAAEMMLVERETILSYVYNSFNTEHELGLKADQLQTIFTNVRGATLNISQIEASMNYVCACPFLCDQEELLDVLNEMDRRYYLAHDLQWEFALLDYQRKGAISKSDTAFLFKMVYGEFFSKFKFERMMNERKVPTSDVSFAEIEVGLCNVPTKDWIEELMHEEEKEFQEQEYLRKENGRKLKEVEESKRREEELKRQMEEEDKKLKELLSRKKEEKAELEKKKAEDEKRQQEEARRKVEEEEQKASEEEKLAAEKAEQERLAAEKAEQERFAAEKTEKERLAFEKSEQDRLAAEKAEQDRLAAKKAEEERLATEKAEQDRLAAEKAKEERLSAEKAEQEAVEAENTEKKEELSTAESSEVEAKKKERAVGNWRKAKVVSKAELRRQRIKKLHKIKTKNDSEEASKQSQNAEDAFEAEKAAEEEIARATTALETATSQEEKKKAEKAKRKAKKQALQMKEKRLRATLKASCRLRSKPRIDAAVGEAKEALPEIPDLKPAIEVAEKVLDSIQCGDNLDEAIAKRSLEDIESSVETIKTKGYENDHVVKLKEANRLAEKLKRLEKLKKEIMELNQRTISEIRSYKKPSPAIHDIMIATYVILGYKEKDLKDWKYIQALLGKTGKEGLKRQCTTLDVAKINMKNAGIADKNYLSKHDLETITDISAGAATFFVWSTAMIEEVRSWNEDSELRAQLTEKKKKEEEETRLLAEEKMKRQTAIPRNRSVAGRKSSLREQQQREESISDKQEKTPKKDGKNAKPPASLSPAKKKRSPTPTRKNLKADGGDGAKSRSRSKSPGKNKNAK